LKYVSAFVLVIGFVCSYGCGSHVKTGVSPTADVRNAAGKIEETGHTIFTTVVKLRQDMPNQVSQQSADTVAMAVNRLGHVGLDLNKALDAYLATKAATQDSTQTRAAVQAILGSVNDAMAEVGKALPPGTFQQIDLLVQQVLSLVLQIRGVL
jgi:molybdopterin converting factor small subunit